MSLPTRQIGPFTVSSIGYGCMNLSHAYGVPPAPEEGARLLNLALDLGVTLLDTAAIYGGGNNERLLGASVMHRRSEFTLASKCVLDLVDGKRMLDARPEVILASLDRSLERLGTDHIDLFYLHRPDRNVPIEDSVGALAGAVQAGKIRHIGLSEMNAEAVRRAHAVHPIAAVQTEYSPAVRNPEIAVLETCRELGIGFVAFSPVARGLLAGGITDENFAPADLRNHMARFREPNLSRNLEMIAPFNALAREAGMTPAQLSLAWVLSRAPHIMAIPGTIQEAHLREDVAAATITAAPDLLAQVDAILPPNALAGPRYSAPLQAQVSTEILPGEELATA